MSAEPLSREMRDFLMAQRLFPPSTDLQRYEATVQAAEERAGALERLIDYAMLLHVHGEAPPGHELATWAGWYRSVREFFGHEPADDAARGDQ